MRLREPILVAVVAFVVLGIAGVIGDPWASAAVYGLGAGIAVFVYTSGKGRDGG